MAIRIDELVERGQSGEVREGRRLHEVHSHPSFVEVCVAANRILDDTRSDMLTRARAARDTETLIDILVVSSVPGIKSAAVEIRPGELWARIADCTRIPTENFPKGLPAALGGGIFAVELHDKSFETNNSNQAGLADFIVIPPRAGLFPEGAIIETGEFSPRDPDTFYMSTKAQGATRLRHKIDGDVILGQPYTDPTIISQLTHLTEEICWAIDHKNSQAQISG